MRTSNPAFRHEAFAPGPFGGIMESLREQSAVKERSTTMTIGGTIAKTSILLVLCAASAIFSWNIIVQNLGLMLPLGLGGAIVGLVLGLIIGFNPKTAPVLSPIYAIVEGAFVGAISLIIASQVKGDGLVMVGQAVLATFSIMAAMLASYAFGIVRLGSTATKVVIIATGGIAVLYAISLVLNLIGFGGVGFIHSAGPFGIAFSVFVIAIAALNLVLDFQFIEAGVQNGAPKHMEWYGGFGLLVTLVWLYIEVLRLLSKLRRD